MKIFTARLCVLLAGVATLASCLKDDDDNNTGYPDTAIIQFTLGTLNRYTTTTSSATGNDTVLKTTVTGSQYAMTIDQHSRQIYNGSELPIGTDIKHVICTVTTKNSGVVAIQSMISDSLKWHSSTDSVDFSKPRVFRVYSSDLSKYRDYTVTVNVSETTGVSFEWTNAGRLDMAEPAKMTLTAVADTVMLSEKDSTLGASLCEIYMIDSDGHLMASPLGGDNWQAEQLDDDEALLPAAGHAAMASWEYGPATAADYVLMVGTPRQQDEPYMRVWRKIAPHSGGGQWIYMPVDDSNNFAMPRQEGIVMAYYDKSVLAVGSDMVMRQSRDEGITWKQNSTYDLPDGISGNVIAMTADRLGRLWMLTSTGQLWRGYVSK